MVARLNELLRTWCRNWPNSSCCIRYPVWQHGHKSCCCSPAIAACSQQLCQTWYLGLVTEFLSEKFLRNRLGTASVIPRKKVLIPRHSEVYWRVYSEARNGRKWHEKNLFKKILLQQTELTACFRLRHASEQNSLSCCLFRGMVQSRIPSVCLHFVPRNGIPSCFIFCGMVQNRISSAEWFRTEFRAFASNFVPWSIPSSAE